MSATTAWSVDRPGTFRASSSWWHLRALGSLFTCTRAAVRGACVAREARAAVASRAFFDEAAESARFAA
eukprot:CAMPEP_0179958722 /NCGR_PEP_ID=MMETSP0983-20121128/28182_1 /TAXON_ID=483367 /ORGANISM="non described non described, Strain CCMP 2436" /LENGTH=68 /DNA_ID=CAMNT_0021870871 /DNA_START=63 /DNA_END=266 /DNA_ORIENTATION=-